MFNSVQYNRMLDDEMKYTFGIKNLPAHLPQTAYGDFSAVVFMQSYIENHSAFRMVLRQVSVYIIRHDTVHNGRFVGINCLTVAAFSRSLFMSTDCQTTLFFVGGHVG